MAGLEMYASVYREMRKVGLADPRAVDQLEIWEIAVLLGTDQADEAGGGSDNGDKYAHLRARVAHEQGLGPKPEWTEPNPDEMALMVALGGSSL